MIKPTVGRIVWYWAANPVQSQPHAAIVTHVNTDDNINLAIFDDDGSIYSRTNIHLHQEGDKPDFPYAEWMPYQKGQAAKAETLEQQLKERN